MWKKLSSDYIAAANILRGKTKRKRIVAYVESYDDIFFWRSVLSPLENEKRYFEIMLPTLGKRLERGKKSAITAMMTNKQLGSNMIACVDADYDYLMQGCSYTSQAMLNTPFVFHTYAYAIENLQCYAESLHDVCVMTTLNDHVKFNFVEFLHNYSLIIYPLFLWNIWHYRHARFGEFSMMQFCQMIDTGKLRPGTTIESLANLQAKVQRKVEWFERHYPNERESYEALDKELQEKLGIKPEETYLYIQGHHIFEHLVQPLLQRVCHALVREREEDIRRSAAHSTQARNELSCYSSSVQDTAQMLKKNTGYRNSEIFKKIQQSILDVI